MIDSGIKKYIDNVYFKRVILNIFGYRPFFYLTVSDRSEFYIPKLSYSLSDFRHKLLLAIQTSASALTVQKIRIIFSTNKLFLAYF